MALLEAFRKYIADNDLATHDDRILLTGMPSVFRW